MKITKHPLEDYNKAIELHKQGYGSLRISKILGHNSRGTIEGWLNKGRMPYYFSTKRINASNSKENIERMRAMNKITQSKACKISADLRRKKLPESAKELSPGLGYVLGVCYGDGHISTSQRRVILGVTDEDFALEFQRILENWCGFKTKFFTVKQKDDLYVKNRKLRYVCYLDSKEAAEFLKKWNIRNLLNADIPIKSSFLKGFFDSEGTVKRNNIGLACFNTNYNLINLVKDMLFSLSIDSRLNVRVITKPIKPTQKIIKPYYYTLWLHKKESIIKYHNLIGFTINRKQERLNKQVDYIKSRLEVTTMTTENKGRADNNVVFIGDKPFMKSQ